VNTNTTVNITEDKTVNIEKSHSLYAGMGKQSHDLLMAFNSEEDVSIFDFSIEEARAIFNPIFEASSAPHLNVAQENHKTVKFNGCTIPIIELTPVGNMPDNGWPTLLFLHGGGWILGDYPSYEGLAKSCCYYTKAKIIFVDYALSPESKYPQALEQIIATLNWVNEEHDMLKVDPNRIGLIGDSAGGNLAAALCLSNQKSLEPWPIKIQCLIYPLLDLSVDADYVSRKTYGNGEFFISREHIAWSRKNYLANANLCEELLVSPIKANDLQKQPESIIVAAGFDPLQDEAGAYHHRLLSFGNNSLLLRFTSTIHGFLSFSASLDIANTGLKLICSEIKQRL
jgi:acetyl esterase